VNDISEKKNLARKYPERLKDMVSKTKKWTESFVRPLWYYSAKDEELWNNGKMSQYEETFEISKLIELPSKK